jgi:hypothetical protein
MMYECWGHGVGVGVARLGIGVFSMLQSPGKRCCTF